MPDFAMCTGKDCPKKECCLRYKATPCDNQSWFSAQPIDGDKCDYFWPIFPV